MLSTDSDHGLCMRCESSFQMWTGFLARTMIVGELKSLYYFWSIEAHEALLTTKSTHRSLVLADRTALGIQIVGLVLSVASGFIFAKGEVRIYTMFLSHLNGGRKAIQSGYGFSRCSRHLGFPM